MKSDNMFDYYREQAVLPTYGRFQSAEDLQAHERSRRSLFTNRLHLPCQIFSDAQLIEFGPDSGENSLVFALWGAWCTLVEPNPKALPVIEEYFQRFNLKDKLVGLVPSDLKTLAEAPDFSARLFDLVVAEGFIYTVKPESLWIEFFSRLVSPDGFVILFYEEAYGSVVEILSKVIHHNLVRLTGLSSLEVAERTFKTKWDSIAHKRSMRSWVMDVLDNPFVRLRYFLEPYTLCAQMRTAGFSLYSAWPPYKDGLSVEWFKKTATPEEELEAVQSFISRNRLSHVFARKHYLTRSDAIIDKPLRALVTSLDSLVDKLGPADLGTCNQVLSQIADLMRSDVVMSDPADRSATIETILSVQRILALLSEGAALELIEFCNRDPAFIRSWGTPAHFAVFRKA
jgi:Methyltransferase domain